MAISFFFRNDLTFKGGGYPRPLLSIYVEEHDQTILK